MQKNALWKKFRPWLASSLGQVLMAEEIKKIHPFIQTLFGYHLAFFGEPASLQALQLSPIQHRIWVHPEPYPISQVSSVQTRQDKLPLMPDEIDLVFLAHCLEFNTNPHEVLREAYSVLKPEGHLIITGFNPWSSWALYRCFTRYIRRSPWDGEFISLTRLKDWLALLGFDTVQVKLCCFRPPVESKSWLEKMTWLEKIGSFLFPFWGASYIILAKKRVLKLTPLPFAWKKRKKMIPSGLVEPATRMH